MTLTQDFIDTMNVMADRSPGPRHLPWPMPENAGALLEFRTFADWRDFFFAFRLPQRVPGNMADAFDRALKLAILSWVDGDLYVAAEMAAMAALEHALRDVYLGHEKQRRLKRAHDRAKQKGQVLSEEDNDKAGRVHFAELLQIMVREEKLTDDMIPIAKRCGVKILPVLTGEIKYMNGEEEQIVHFEPSLADMRNTRAHGHVFGSGPMGGLIELVRDLMEFAYRPKIEQMGPISNPNRT